VDEADGLTSGLGVPLADVVWAGDGGELAVCDELAVCAGLEAGVPLDVVDGVGEAGGVSEADGVGEAGGLGGFGASCVHAAMTTRSLAGSALPPMSLRSTK
jgi:hypothetical protein